MSIPVIIVGGGGHAKVLIDILRLRSVAVIGIVDADPRQQGLSILGIPVIGNDDAVARYGATTVLLVNGLGSVGPTDRRQALFEKFKHRGYSFSSVIHPSAVIASDVAVGEGVQVMAGAIVQPGTSIGSNVIVNTRATVDHDCRIDDHVHLAPGVVLSGNVYVGAGAHIGTGATVIQGVKIGRGAVIGAGSVVLNDVLQKSTVVGSPAKVVQQ
jgi:sugar O-acyltransferase (sialic acid O-acetyltransferase NeuD family)